MNKYKTAIFLFTFQFIFLLALILSPHAKAINEWVEVGNAGFSAGNAYGTSLAINNGTPYVLYNDGGNDLKASVMKYNGSNWEYVGNAGFSEDAIQYPSLAIDNGTPYVAYVDQGWYRVTVMKYNGSSWENFGSAGFSHSSASYVSLAVHEGVPYVAYANNYTPLGAIVMKYNGSSWESVGNVGFSEGTAAHISIKIDNGIPYVAYSDGANGYRATVMKYNGLRWESVGSQGFSLDTAHYISLAFEDSIPYVAYSDYGNNQKATVMKYNGSSWENVGNAGFSASYAEYISLVIDNGTPYVAYQDLGSNYKATLMRYNGTVWESVGSVGFSAAQAYSTSLAIHNGIPYVAYQDQGNDQKATVMKNLAGDYGDIPDPSYPTLLANDGARHETDNLIYLGAEIDGEYNGQQNTDANGDDKDGNDDDDGVSFKTALVPGEQSDIEITASASGYLNAWLDFNYDGDWDDIGEQIFTDQLLSAGVNSLSVNVPIDAAQKATFARFRFSSVQGLSYTGLAADGEVEDYKINITSYCQPLGVVPPLSPTQRPEEIKSGLEQLNAPVNKVIITLKNSNTRIPSEKLKLEEIKNSQDKNLDKLSARDFILEHKFKYSPTLTGYATEEVLESLKNDPEVLSARKIRTITTTSTEAVPLVNADDVHTSPYNLKGQGMNVAVLDTGVDTDHLDFIYDNAIITQKCFTSDIYDDMLPPNLIVAADCEGDDPYEGDLAEDQNGHGTNVAGIITSPTGFAPASCIVPIRVTNDLGQGTEDDWLKALEWIRDNQEVLEIDVINISLEAQNSDGSGLFFDDFASCETGFPELKMIIDELNNQGTVVFAGTGNRGNHTGISSPACLSNVVAVGATYDSNMGREPDAGTYRDPGTGNPDPRWADCYDATTNGNTITCFSNLSTNLSNIIVAPGSELTTTGVGGGTSTYYGTSQASPVAAGIGALMLQADKSLSSSDILNKIKTGGVGVTIDINGEGTVEYKRVDALNSVNNTIAPECENIADISTIECMALKELYDQTGGAGWTNKTGWLSDNTACDWHGLSCSYGKITSINLSSNNLIGNMPEELQNLLQLNTLDLSYNQLSGIIPQEIGNLYKLSTLNLGGNQITGTIPPTLGRLNGLTTLNLGMNKLEGNIPEEIGDLWNLENINLSYNKLEGTIPEEFTNLINLTGADISYNKLESGDQEVIDFLKIKDPDGDETQTILPGNIQLKPAPEINGIEVSWEPINYQGDGGYYRVNYATVQGGPYSNIGCSTSDKSEQSCIITGLITNTDYYYIVQTYTPAHGNQQNVLWSKESTELTYHAPNIHYVYDPGINSNCGGMSPCYDNIQSATNASVDGEVIKVAAGTYTRSDMQVVLVSKSIYLIGGYLTSDWNIYSPATTQAIIDAENIPGRRGLFVNSGIKLLDVTLQGLVIQRGNVTGDGGGLYILGENVNLVDNVIQNNYATGNGGGVYIKDGLLTTDNDTFYNNSADLGGALYIEDAKMELNNSNFDTNFGAAIYGLNCEGSISGSTIENNTDSATNTGGGGVRIWNHATSYYINFSNNTFDNNQSVSSYGGGALVIGDIKGMFELHNNTFQNNNAIAGAGGGLYTGGSAGTATLKDNTFQNNSAFTGGGIYAHNKSIFIKGGNFQQNAASGSGGGMQIYYDNAAIDNVTFQGNNIADEGGGIYVLNDFNNPNSNMIISNNTITGSIVSSQGGGVFLEGWSGSIIRMHNNDIQNNTSAEGGGLHAQGFNSAACKVYLEENTIKGNIANTSNGGGINIAPGNFDGIFNLNNNIIQDNSSALSGGGIAQFGGILTATNSIVTDNTPEGVYIEEDAYSSATFTSKYSTFANNGNYGVRNNGGTVALTNSIVSSHASVGLYGIDLTADYTLFFNNASECIAGSCTNNFFGDPLFADIASMDYHIKVGSAAIDKALDIGITEDIDLDARPEGSAPDLGADEYAPVTCNRISEIPTAECQALLNLYNNTIGNDWTDNTDWTQTTIPCSWHGITCSAGHVTEINLDYNNLDGTIPAEIGDLSQLSVLNLKGNSLSGVIPSAIGNTGGAGLAALDLSNNKLTGEIPAELTSQTGLTTLDLGYNALRAVDQTLTNYLAAKDPDWDQTQTVPPENIKITVAPDKKLVFSWDPINYQADGGYYRISYSLIQGGPYNQACATANKTSSGCTTGTIQANKDYYFIIQSYTPAHTGQLNELWSENSEEKMVRIVPDAPSLITSITSANISGYPTSLYLDPNENYIIEQGMPGEEENGLPTITGNISIYGSGGEIERSDLLETIPYFRIFNVDAGGQLLLDNIRVINGELEGLNGAGVKNLGTLILNEVTLSQNIGLSGGGVYNQGQAAITNSTIENNMAFNTGAGLENTSGANINISGSLIKENIAGSGGGGVNNLGTVTIDNTEITNNLGAAGGALSNGGNASLSSTQLIGNATIDPNLINDPGTGVCDHDDPFKGGGICNYGTFNSNGLVIKSNAAIDLGGGTYNDGTAGAIPINSSCIMGNAAKTNDAIINESTASLDATGNWWGYSSGPTPPGIIGGDVNTSSPLSGSILGCPTGIINDDIISVKNIKSLPFEDNEYIDTTLQPLGSLVPSCGTSITKGIYYQIADDKAVAEKIIGRSRIGGIIGRSRIGGIVGRTRIGGLIGRARIGGTVGEEKFRLKAAGEDFSPVVSIFAENYLGSLEEISCAEGLNYTTEVDVVLNPGVSHYVVIGFKDTDDGVLNFKTESLQNPLPVEVEDYSLIQAAGNPDTYTLNLTLLNVRDYNLSNLQVKLLAEENSGKVKIISGTATIGSILEAAAGTTGSQLQVQFTQDYTSGDTIKFFVEITEEINTAAGTRSVKSTVPITIPQKLKIEFWDFDDEQPITGLPDFPPTSDPRYRDDELLGLEEYAVRWLEDIDLENNEYYSLTHDKGGELSEQFYNRMVGRLTGSFRAEHSGVYEFYLTVDDGGRLKIDGNTVIDDTGPRVMDDGSVMGSITLTKGWHDLEIQYFEDLGGNGLKLEYKDPIMSAVEIIPARLFGDLDPAVCGTLCNENFEQGELYWKNDGKSGSITVDTSAPYEGTNSLKTEQLYTAGDPARWTGITQYAQVKEGAVYNLKVWLKTLNASNGHVRARWRDESGSILSTQYPIGGINGTDSTWFYKEAKITAPVNAAKAEISLWHGVNGGINVPGSTIGADNITLICESICNGGFEDGYSQWETKRPGQIGIETTNAQEGTKAIKIIQDLDPSDVTQWSIISQRTLVTGGESYGLSFWLKKENAARGHVKLIWEDVNDQIISQQFPIGGINGTDLIWAQLSTTVTAPVNAEAAEILFLHGVDGINNNAFGSTLYVDDVNFEQISSNDTPTNITLSSNAVDENQPAGTTVGTLSTQDPDAGDTHTYEMVPGSGDTDNSSFAIINDELKTNEVFDYETKSSYTVRIKSADNGGLFIEKTFGININDINEPPGINIIQPDGTNDSTVSEYTIVWEDSDPDDNASISLYYDTDNSGTDGTLIVSGINEDGANYYVWDTTLITPGEYYIYGIITDGSNPQAAGYSSGTLTILAACTSGICNPSFEDNLDYWNKNGTPDNTISTDAIDGNNSLRSEHTRTGGENPSWSGVNQKINSVQPAQTYGLGMWIKSQDGAQGHVKIKWYNAGGTVSQVDYPIININGTLEWTSFSKLVTSPADAVSGEISIWHGINAISQNVLGSTVWVDNIEFDTATSACGTLCNESFEQGLLYWTVSGAIGSHNIETTGAHEGLKSARSEQLYTSGEAAKWAGITQYAQVKEGITYRFRVWLKKNNLSNGHVRIRWRSTSGSLLSTEYPISGINGTTAAWYRRDANVTAPVNAAKAEISIWHGVNGGVNVEGSTMWIDNITLICPNLCNGGFEDGTIHWEANGKNEAEIITSDVQEGTQAVKVEQGLGTSDNTQWAGISQRTLVNGGESYNLSFWMKKENIVQGHVKVKWRDVNDQLISQQFPIGGLNGTNLTWSQMNTTLTAPVNAETAEIFIWHGVDGSNNNATGSTLYLDNIMFAEIP